MCQIHLTWTSPVLDVDSLSIYPNSDTQASQVAICIIKVHRSRISPFLIHLIFLKSLYPTKFSFFPHAFDFSFLCLVPCVFLYSDLFDFSVFSKISLNSSSAFWNEILHKLLSFMNFLHTCTLLAKMLNNIRSVLWRALCNIFYPFFNKLLSSFLGKILQQLYSNHIFPVGLWVSCESDIYYFLRSCYPVKEIELHWHELFLTNSCWCILSLGEYKLIV